jgi:hypothetical protein
MGLFAEDEIVVKDIRFEKYANVTFDKDIYKKDYDDHFNLIKTETNFYTHYRAVCYSVYDLLMNF